jgi:hypothetical protein
MQHSIPLEFHDEVLPLPTATLSNKPGLVRRLGSHSRTWILAMAFAAGTQASILGEFASPEDSIPKQMNEER